MTQNKEALEILDDLENCFYEDLTSDGKQKFQTIRTALMDDGWRDIESAPKDGIEIIVTGGHSVICSDYHEDETIHDDIAIVMWDPCPIEDAYKWCCKGYSNGDIGYYINPTRWRPLPALPKGQKQ